MPAPLSSRLLMIRDCRIAVQDRSEELYLHEQLLQRSVLLTELPGGCFGRIASGWHDTGDRGPLGQHASRLLHPGSTR